MEATKLVCIIYKDLNLYVYFAINKNLWAYTYFTWVGIGHDKHGEIETISSHLLLVLIYVLLISPNWKASKA